MWQPNLECSEIVVKFYMALGIYEVVYSQLNSFMKLIFQVFIKSQAKWKHAVCRHLGWEGWPAWYREEIGRGPTPW